MQDIDSRINELIDRGIIISLKYPTSKLYKDPSGKIVNNIKVIRYIGIGKQFEKYYELECFCGNRYVGRINHAKSCERK